MTSSKSDKVNLASHLRKWTVDEMRFQSSSYSTQGTVLPTDKDFERLCRRPFSSIWQFCLDHIKATDYVKTVQDNLVLHRRTRGGGERKKLEDGDKTEYLKRRKQELEAEISSCSADVTLMEREMKQVSRLMEETSLDYEKSLLHVRNLQRKKCLLGVVAKRAEEKTEEYTEYVNRFISHTDSLKRKKKEESKNNYLASFIQDSQSDMETESCRDVRQACEGIASCAHSAMDEDEDRHIIEENKKEVVAMVTDLHSCYNIHTIAESLAAYTVSSSKLLREDTVRINIASDAKDLSFSLDRRGNLHDESKPPTLQKSVVKLLQASSLNHVMRWFEEQRYTNESWKMEAQLNNMRAEIHKLIVKSVGSSSDLVILAESCADQLLHLASEQAVTPCLKQEIESIQNQIIKAKSERDELRDKFAKIEEFKEIVERKQNLLSSVARLNSTAPGRLEKQKEQCKLYLKARPVESHLVHIQTSTSDLCGSLQKEIGRFHPLPFVCFLSIAMESGLRASLIDLSIAPSALPGADNLLQTNSVLCQALDYPKFKSPDQLTAHILHLHRSVQESHLRQVKAVANRKSMCKQAGVEDDPHRHRELLQENEKKDEQLLKMFRPQLAQLEELAQKWTRKVTECVPESLESWWEQPGQYATPWVLVDGVTFDQWMQRYRVIVTQVHKKHMEKQKDSASK